MTLWGIVITADDQTLSTRLARRDRNSAVESAGRINDWAYYMWREHPDHAARISAEVVEWPGTAEEHAVELAKAEAYEQEEEH